jgi:hypothetical protein
VKIAQQYLTLHIAWRGHKRSVGRFMETTQPDLIKCSCNNCSGHLQFERQHAGQRVDCPHCGMETLLYVPQGVPPVTPPPPPITTAEGEPAFLNEGGVAVTKTRFMVHAQTYALANITSVSAARIPAKRGGAQFWVFLGVVVSALALFALCKASRETWLVCLCWLIGGLTIAGVAFSILKNLQDSYVVVLNTAGNETKALTSRDQGFISRVVAALNTAIVARG